MDWRSSSENLTHSHQILDSKYTRLARVLTVRHASLICLTCFTLHGAELPANRWVQLAQDPAGGRRGSAIRWAPEAGVFLLWGFIDHDPELLQEQPLMEAPEYDMVAFDPAEGRWRNHLPRSRET